MKYIFLFLVLLLNSCGTGGDDSTSNPSSVSTVTNCEEVKGASLEKILAAAKSKKIEIIDYRVNKGGDVIVVQCGGTLNQTTTNTTTTTTTTVDASDTETTEVVKKINSGEISRLELISR